MKLLTNSTPIALWHDVVQEAEAKCGIPLNEELESYLVFLLMRYLKRPEFAKQIMAVEYLQSLEFPPSKRLMALQEIGDKCLLFSGLYPHIAEKRLVKISYFVRIGRSAYISVSKNNDLFGSLAKHFVTMMDVLQTIQAYTQNQPDLLPIDAYNLWNETNSQRALNILRQYTKAIPVNVSEEVSRPIIIKK